MCGMGFPPIMRRIISTLTYAEPNRLLEVELILLPASTQRMSPHELPIRDMGNPMLLFRHRTSRLFLPLTITPG